MCDKLIYATHHFFFFPLHHMQALSSSEDICSKMFQLLGNMSIPLFVYGSKHAINLLSQLARSHKSETEARERERERIQMRFFFQMMQRSLTVPSLTFCALSLLSILLNVWRVSGFHHRRRCHRLHYHYPFVFCFLFH